MSTREEILEAVQGSFAKKDVVIDKAKKAIVTVHELSRQKRDELEKSIFAVDDDGKFISVDKNDKPDPKGEFLQVKEGVYILEEWIAATMEPKFSVEELRGPEWPESLKKTIYNAARKINGLTVEEAAGN